MVQQVSEMSVWGRWSHTFLSIFTNKPILSIGRFYSKTISTIMLITIGIILVVLWLLGIIGVFTIGSFIHILLVIAIIVFLVRVIKGDNPLK